MQSQAPSNFLLMSRGYGLLSPVLDLYMYTAEILHCMRDTDRTRIVLSRKKISSHFL